MNIKNIELALAAYKVLLDEDAYQRLEHYRGIWELQNRFRLQAAVDSPYAMPPLKEAEEWYWQGKPLLQLSPTTVSPVALGEALRELTAYLVEHAGLEQDMADILPYFDWRGVIDQADIMLLGSNPFAYAEDFCAQALAHSKSLVQPEISSLVLLLAIRPLLEPAASALMACLGDAVKEGGLKHTKPLHCPVCGGRAAAALVGETQQNQGEGRQLYCNICSAIWEFERIRCGRCGSANQGQLHYYHIEGDDAHRLHTCDACGNYLRTIFQEYLKPSFAFEVEDLVMLPLDIIARDESFKDIRS